MKINAIAIKTMILMLVKISLQRNYHIFTAVYADDLTTSGPIGQLKIWWNAPCKLSPKFGYPEGSKLRSVIRKKKCGRTCSIHLPAYQNKDHIRR